jgi:hypothetical protein
MMSFPAVAADPQPTSKRQKAARRQGANNISLAWGAWAKRKKKEKNKKTD